MTVKDVIEALQNVDDTLVVRCESSGRLLKGLVVDEALFSDKAVCWLEFDISGE